MFFGNTASDHVVNARAGPGYHRSTLLLSFPMLPAPHILKGSCRGIRCHQPISHPLVDQGGVRSYCTQQHREASVQHLTNAAPQTKPQLQHISVTKSFLPLCDRSCLMSSPHCWLELLMNLHSYLPFVAQRSMRRQWKNWLGGGFFLLLPFQQNNLQLGVFDTGHICPLTHCRKMEREFMASLNTG